MADDVWLSCCRRLPRQQLQIHIHSHFRYAHTLQAPPELPADHHRCPLNPAASVHLRSHPFIRTVQAPGVSRRWRIAPQATLPRTRYDRTSLSLAVVAARLEQMAGGRSVRRGFAHSRATWCARHLLSTYHARIKPDAHRSTACHARHLTTATRSLRLIALFLCERRYTK